MGEVINSWLRLTLLTQGQGEIFWISPTGFDRTHNKLLLWSRLKQQITNNKQLLAATFLQEKTSAHLPPSLDV
jgi:hypothetical protein